MDIPVGDSFEYFYVHSYLGTWNKFHVFFPKLGGSTTEQIMAILFGTASVM